MRFIKLAILSFIFLFLIITGISLFIPSRVRISRALDIHAPKEKVMDYIANPVKWKDWYPGGDSAGYLYVNDEVRGIRSGPDAMKGIMITEKNDSSVMAANVGPGAKEILMGWNIFSSEDFQPVTVQWYMDFHLRWYPWEKFSSLLYEKIYGLKMEEGLTNLKTILEKEPSIQ